jgi:hypothetical protein
MATSYSSSRASKSMPNRVATLLDQQDDSFQAGWIMPNAGNKTLIFFCMGVGLLLGEAIPKLRRSVLVVLSLAALLAGGTNHVVMAQHLDWHCDAAHRPPEHGRCGLDAPGGQQAKSTPSKSSSYSGKQHLLLLPNSSGNNGMNF